MLVFLIYLSISDAVCALVKTAARRGIGVKAIGRRTNKLTIKYKCKNNLKLLYFKITWSTSVCSFPKIVTSAQFTIVSWLPQALHPLLLMSVFQYI